jgi:hypothetical protein
MSRIGLLVAAVAEDNNRGLFLHTSSRSCPQHLAQQTSALALNPKPEWEKTSLDLDMTALYHYVGFLYDGKQKK